MLSASGEAWNICSKKCSCDAGAWETGIEQEISEQGTLPEERSEGTKDGGAPACRAFCSFSARAKPARAGWRTPSPIANPPPDRRFQRRTRSTGRKVTGVILKWSDAKRHGISLPLLWRSQYESST